MPLESTKSVFKKLTGSLFGKENGGDEVSNHSYPAFCGNATDVSTKDDGSASTRDVQQGHPAEASPIEQPSDKQNQARSIPESKPAGSLEKTTVQGSKNSFFFARVPPIETHEQLLELFREFGEVEDLNLFRPFAEAKTSKGCGIVRYSTAGAAAAAKAALHHKYKWSEDASPMVVEWVNEDKMRSTCQKAGSKEIVFKPKSRTKAQKQREQQHNAAQQQQPSGTAYSGNTVLQRERGAMGAMLGDSASSNDQLLLRQTVFIGRQQQLAQGAVSYTLQQQQQRTSFKQQPPPPPPPPPRTGAFAQRRLQPQQQWPLAASVAASAAAVRQVLLNSQQQQQQFSGVRGFNSDPLPSVSAVVAAVAAAAQHQDRAQAALAAGIGAAGLSNFEAYVPTFSADPGQLANAAAALQQQQQQQLGMSGLHQMPLSGAFSAVSPGIQKSGGYDNSQHLLLLTSGTGGLAGGAVAPAAVTDSSSAGLPVVQPVSGAFSLLDTSSLTALQSEYLITSNASSVSAAHAFGNANASDAADNNNNSAFNSASLLQAAQPCFSSSSMQQQQYNPGSSLAAGAAGFGGSSNAALRSQGPWRAGGGLDASFSAFSAGVGRCLSAAENISLLQRQITSEGCNILSGGAEAAHAVTLSGSCAPGAKSRQQQEQPQLPYDDQWPGNGGSGYFDMPGSSSTTTHNAGGGFCSGSNIVQGNSNAAADAALSGSNLALVAQSLQVNSSSSSAAAAAAALQQQLLATGGPNQLRVLSDSGMVGLNTRALGRMQVGRAASATGVAVQQQPQLQQQLLQQQLAGAAAAVAALSGHSSSAAATAAAGAAASADTLSEVLKRQLNLRFTSTGSNMSSCTTLPEQQAAAAALDNSASLAAAAAAAAAGAPDAVDAIVTIPLAHGSVMVQLLGMHIDSITKLSGAEVQIRAEAGELIIWAKGTLAQTAMAQNIVDMLQSTRQTF